MSRSNRLIWLLTASLGWGLFGYCLAGLYTAKRNYKEEITRLEQAIQQYESGEAFRTMRESFYASESRIGELKRELYEQDRELTRLKAKLAVRGDK